MSIMFAGVDRAIKNMNAKRHHDIVDAIQAGDGRRCTSGSRAHGRRRKRSRQLIPSAQASVRRRLSQQTKKRRQGSRAQGRVTASNAA
jgi:hypothetical protein